jgi:hypothetical protein
VEKFVEWELEGEAEIFGEILPQYRFLYYKFRMT